ncbi:MAG: hypothetical protein H0V94_10030 [Actinobacteria bacterium]|nr:hypothetical protein [Actinomycetota bacterium]
MSELAFLSPALAEAGYRSPLERPLAGSELRDLSPLGKLEHRGDLDGAALEGQSLGRVPNGHGPGTVPPQLEIVRIATNRTFVLCAAEDAPAFAARLGAVDRSAALAGLALHGEQLMRRLTDLDLDALPAVGAVAGVQATVLRDGDEFRLFFAQEYADHVAAVVLDGVEGLR